MKFMEKRFTKTFYRYLFIVTYTLLDSFQRAPGNWILPSVRKSIDTESCLELKQILMSIVKCSEICAMETLVWNQIDI